MLNLCFSLKNNLRYAEGRNDLFGLVSGAQHDWKVYWKPVTFHFIDVLNPGTFICAEIFQSSCAVCFVLRSNTLSQNCCWYSCKFLRLTFHEIII